MGNRKTTCIAIFWVVSYAADMRKKSKNPFRILKILLICSILLLVADMVHLWFLVDINSLKTTIPPKTAYMKYRENHRGTHRRKVNRIYIPMSKISKNIRRAVVLSEDAKFWRHEGFDFEAIKNAVETNIETKQFKLGASTISMQLARNLYLSPSKNPYRKFREAILTYRIEHTISKSRILEIYLNVVEWGDGIFGVEAASRHYFHKSASNISLQEACLLAAVLPNPIRFSPVKPTPYIRKKARIIHGYVASRK